METAKKERGNYIILGSSLMIFTELKISTKGS
jgi:hypothetical protein